MDLSWLKTIIVSGFNWIWQVKTFLPFSISFFVVLIDIIKDSLLLWDTNPFGIINLIAIRFLAVDYRMYQLINIFRQTPETFTFGAFITILAYAFLFYFFIKFIVKLFTYSIGEGMSVVMYVFWSLIIVLLLEFSVVRFVVGETYIPLTGVVYFIIYFPQMMSHIWTNKIESGWNKFVSYTVIPELRDKVLLNTSQNIVGNNTNVAQNLSSIPTNLTS